MLQGLWHLITGKARNPLDPKVFQHLSLGAFLAWVALGADGLSSSCYGPEEAFRALSEKGHEYLAIPLAGMIAFTVFAISLGYILLIRLFPGGGGGYLVATKLLGRYPGLIAGCALMVDYVLTIAISVASGADQVFSLLPPSCQAWRFPVALGFVAFMVMLNLRGVLEPMAFLVPVFLTFVLTHTVAVLGTLGLHLGGLGTVAAGAIHQGSGDMSTLGLGGVLLLLLRAYSHGAGTYTGIEAVSNSMPILRDPKVETGRSTMIYMACSLAFTAGGLLLGYLLLGLHPAEGKTMNALLLERFAAEAGMGGAAGPYVVISMISAGCLLLVAAQAGFLAGPRVLASMAADSWIPRKFLQLSDQLVVQNGVLLMAGMAFAVLLATRGDVSVLVVLYSVNVFITFTLSQYGLCRHWLQHRAEEPGWRWKLAVNGFVFLLTAGILVTTVVLKFGEGGWASLALTAVFIGFCLFIRRHYDRAGQALRRIDASLVDIALPERPGAAAARDPNAPTAVLMVGGYNGMGLHAFLTVHRFFTGHFRNFVFVSVGVVDTGTFKGEREVAQLREKTEQDLKKYVDMAVRSGFYAESRCAFSVDPVEELERLCLTVQRDFPHSICFAGRLIFPEEGMVASLLHNQTAMDLQRRLHYAGLPLVVLPVRAQA